MQYMLLIFANEAGMQGRSKAEMDQMMARLRRLLRKR